MFLLSLISHLRGQSIDILGQYNLEPVVRIHRAPNREGLSLVSFVSTSTSEEVGAFQAQIPHTLRTFGGANSPCMNHQNCTGVPR